MSPSDLTHPRFLAEFALAVEPNSQLEFWDGASLPLPHVVENVLPELELKRPPLCAVGTGRRGCVITVKGGEVWQVWQS